MYLIEFTLFLSFLTHIYATFGQSFAEKGTREGAFFNEIRPSGGINPSSTDEITP
ncbi:MAG: hypothetical protein MSO56_08580 [Clostridiales bacterium]|nr:hypothetical protein [Clostridiales bacterium]